MTAALGRLDEFRLHASCQDRTGVTDDELDELLSRSPPTAGRRRGSRPRGRRQSAAASDKFVHHVLTGRYASGFANSLMAKDLGLYLGAVDAQGAPSTVGEVTASF